MLLYTSTYVIYVTINIVLKIREIGLELLFLNSARPRMQGVYPGGGSFYGKTS